MRRITEIGLAVAAFVAVPTGVGILARSEPAAPAPAAATPGVARALALATHCTRTTHPHSIVLECTFKGGGHCTFDVPRQRNGPSASACVIPRGSQGQMPLLGYGTPPPS